MSKLKLLVILSTFLVLQACKLAVIVVEGGEVQSIGSGTCPESTICVHQVSDTSFSETFTAVPDSGWAFVKWNAGGGFFCQGSTDPACVVSSVGTEGDASIEALIASNKTFYIMPIFEPISEPVTGDGKEWLQPKDFTNHSYLQVSEVCPAGACSGSLPGSTFDLTGYTWASIDEMEALFNSYGNLASAILEDFAYLSKDKSTLILASMVRDPGPEEGAIYIALVMDSEPDGPAFVDSAYESAQNILEARADTGIWFWRPVNN
jgi:hypothetical protein